MFLGFHFCSCFFFFSLLLENNLYHLICEYRYHVDLLFIFMEKPATSSYSWGLVPFFQHGI